MDLTEKLNRGIAAAEAGDKAEARRLLKEVVKTDERQIEAWLWLSQVVDSLEERQISLENILTLDPANQFAQEELDRVNIELEAFYAPSYTYTPDEQDSPPDDIDVSDPREMPSKDALDEAAEFDNEWLCPYCLALTRPKDKTCPTCRKPLIVRKRVKEERTVWLWRSIFLQGIVAFFTLAIGFGLFTLIVKLNGVSSPVPFLPVYFGLPGPQPDNVTDYVLALFPRWVFWGLVAFSFYSAVLLVLLYLRVPYGNVIYLISGCILLVFGLFVAIFYYNSIPAVTVGILLFILGTAQVLLSYTLWNDFLFEEGRLRLKLDRGVKTSTSAFISARKYIRLKMWGLAIIHLRRAAFMAPQNETHHAVLAMAYMEVNRYDLAEKTINNIELFSPDSHEVWRLRKKLAVLSNQ